MRCGNGAFWVIILLILGHTNTIYAIYNVYHLVYTQGCASNYTSYLCVEWKRGRTTVHHTHHPQPAPLTAPLPLPLFSLGLKVNSHRLYLCKFLSAPIYIAGFILIRTEFASILESNSLYNLMIKSSRLCKYLPC